MLVETVRTSSKVVVSVGSGDFSWRVFDKDQSLNADSNSIFAIANSFGDNSYKASSSNKHASCKSSNVVCSASFSIALIKSSIELSAFRGSIKIPSPWTALPSRNKCKPRFNFSKVSLWSSVSAGRSLEIWVMMLFLPLYIDDLMS
ncbi:MAG: hypothetical protein CG439_2630 [Methylococcaceae bacterium NSP1-2]|nr:MAG: hypothetical protein CG439_2630 [Methylococcaceae bacterium NSP1-2]